MKKTLAVIIAAMLLTGCWAPVLIGLGAVAGYCVSNDSAKGDVILDYRKLWDVALEKLASMEAEIIETNESKGTIKAKVSDTSLTIRINTINRNTQLLVVSGRKGLIPDSHTAQKVFLKIIEGIK